MIDWIIKLISKKTAFYLKRVNRTGVIAAFPDLLESEVDAQEIELLQNTISEKIRENLFAGTPDRYEIVIRDMNPVAETVMELALVRYLYPEWIKIWDVMGEDGLTIENASKICFYENKPVFHEYAMMQEAYEQLQKWFYFDRNEKEPFIRKIISMDDRLYAFLSGSDVVKREYTFVGRRVDARSISSVCYVHQKEMEGLENYIRNSYKREEYRVIHVQGSEKNGKKFLAAQVEKELGNSVVFVNYDDLKAQEIQIARRLIWFFYRECFFYQAVPCFYNVTKDTCANREEVEDFLHLCLFSYGHDVPRVYVCTDETVDLASVLTFPIYKLELGTPDRSERILLWESFAKEKGLVTPLDTAVISAKYKLSVGQIQLAVEYLRQYELSGETVDEKRIGLVCNRILPPPSQGSIRRVETEFTIEDLKLQPSQKNILYQICNHVWHRHKVFDTWNMESKFSYGTGVSCLFAGPPGTGKTMAAQIMATMLELPLYRVDLSQVVDKYIGETEKKLEAIFNLAEKSNTILFFDEADSIFGKRSEVNEAKDRYANTEVSYILQRIDEYDGIVILATNFKNNIDEAFMRRIRYVVEFVMPDAEMRYEIWTGCFPKEVPTEDIDFHYLANNFELSGGNIKNIVLNAVFLAAAEDVPVHMMHILESLRMEKLKMGKVMIARDFGEYGFYFEKETNAFIK